MKKLTDFSPFLGFFTLEQSGFFAHLSSFTSHANYFILILSDIVCLLKIITPSFLPPNDGVTCPAVSAQKATLLRSKLSLPRRFASGVAGSGFTLG
jgi:hypothetical protein